MYTAIKFAYQIRRRK